MPKYQAKVKITFMGDVEVVANSKLDAKEIVENGFWALIGTLGTNDEDILDWSIDSHAENIRVLTVYKPQ